MLLMHRWHAWIHGCISYKFTEGKFYLFIKLNFRRWWKIWMRNYWNKILLSLTLCTTIQNCWLLRRNLLAIHFLASFTSFYYSQFDSIECKNSIYVFDNLYFICGWHSLNACYYTYRKLWITCSFDDFTGFFLIPLRARAFAAK